MKRIPYRKKKEVHKAAGDALWDYAKEGKDYILEIKENRPVRSVGQNRMFHAIMGIYCTYTGHHMDDMKIEFKRENFFEWRQDKLGKDYKHLKSTGKADTAEMTIAINRLMEWGRSLWPECIVPDPKTMSYQRLLEIEEQYEKEFSGW